MTPDVGGRGLSWRDTTISFALYLSVFAALAWPWLVAANYAVPSSGVSHRADERVVAWILAWVSHALFTAPRQLMDANINYPAPGQLAGIEHFLSTQLLFAPVFWATGNAVLSANVAVLLTYPLGALAMQHVLVALGCRRYVAWVGGLVFALGPLRVPGNLMTLKYVNLYLALVGLGLTRLREQPRLRRALLLSTALTLAFLSSYYLAVMVLIVGSVWGALEWLRREPARGRFTMLALGATGVSLVPFALVSLPYLQHADASRTSLPTSRLNVVVNTLNWQAELFYAAPVVVVLAMLGVACAWSAAPAARRGARLGVAMALIGGVLMLGSVVRVGSWQVPLPFQLFAHTPLRFFQAPIRFAVVFGLGTTLLTAAALEGVRHRFGRPAGMLAAAATAIAVLATIGAKLSGPELDRIESQTHPIYASLAAVAAGDGPGSLLVLPRISLVAALKNPALRSGSDSEAMVGSTRHWLPLVTGEISHPPPHRRLVNDCIARLPAADALDDIIDMSHLRWLLLRPVAAWPAQQVATRSALLASPRFQHRVSLDGWDLLRVVGEPGHAEWFAAIAAGARADRSVLGTPLTTIPESAARAEVTAMGPLTAIARTGRPLLCGLRIRNVGSAPWPVTLPRGSPPTHTVRLSARWWPAGQPHDPGTVVASEDFELRRDLAPGDEISSFVQVRAPDRAGLHDLEIGIAQVGGARFDGPGNAPLRARIELTATE